MKLFRFASTAALCLLMAVVLAAQGAPQGAPQTPAPRADQAAAQARDAAEITIVGCLAQDKSSPDDFVLTIAPAATAGAATAGAAGAATAGDPAPATNPRPGGTPGSDVARASSGGAAARPATYKITGLDDEKLKPHVNQQVELKGRIKAASAAAASGGAAQEFDASSVKMINATCPAAK
jgi:hypothetical protein